MEAFLQILRDLPDSTVLQAQDFLGFKTHDGIAILGSQATKASSLWLMNIVTIS
jgi:hypothetical protein